MNQPCLVSVFAILACTASRGATVLADRIVVTNSIPNPGGSVISHWAEVQVFQQGSGTNVAAGLNGATATASSSGWGTSPGWAIDGNTDGNFNAGSTWHDADDAGPDVFTVVFSAPVSVDSFNIWGRSDCCPERDDNFNVEFFNGTTLVGSNNQMGIGGTFNTGVTPINAIPEPSLMMILPVSGLFFLRRRRA